MGIELFGAHYAVYFAVACFVAFMASGHSGIYLSQRVAVGKGTIQDGSGEGDVTLRDWYKRAIQDEEPPPPKS
nr:hypothetical protein [Verrucomicrobium spinosum]